ncbi:MAG: 7-cyano-7-deazaguanine synthase QueC [Bacteroidota bacterium]|nr:7-cyano-7-deazaguanine synthase QueC [Bacteroidota bacterium]MDP4192846.1 7-cyano-7-deazaguanine synthase QueC [Bacteroidota bacterium]MDP4197408.1 7-cyano-7-deazaguanine synthase QueC [Bacteroidota bacterium]
MMKKAIVLSSGGLDSTTCMGIARQEGFELYSLSFRYGQRHIFELEASKRVAEYFKANKHLLIDINLREIGGSALTSDIEVPKDRTESDLSHGIPVTYVPARNTIFLSYALAWAEVLSSRDIFIGVNSLDYSGYPDCRAEYISAFQKMAKLATKYGVESDEEIIIHTPLIHLTKAEIIKKGMSLGVDYSITHSCYDPSPEGLACGRCDSCYLRLKGFREAGFEDPVKYVKR